MIGNNRWVCLMYHNVSPGSNMIPGTADYFSVPRDTFDRQLRLIDDLGLRGCSIADALQATGTRRVAISFDDGDLGQATRAFPALAARGMTATFFITTSWVGRSDYASWDQLREMRAAGMSIQSHTHTHPYLSELDADALRVELQRSRDLLDERLGQQTTMIGLPGGDAPRPKLRAMLTDAGYRVVGTSDWGVNQDVDVPPAGMALYVDRCTIRGVPSDELFRAILTGDSWLSVKKRTRHSVLGFVRSSLGPSRYLRWRHRLIDAVGSRGARSATS